MLRVLRDLRRNDRRPALDFRLGESDASKRSGDLVEREIHAVAASGRDRGLLERILGREETGLLHADGAKVLQVGLVGHKDDERTTGSEVGRGGRLTVWFLGGGTAERRGGTDRRGGGLVGEATLGDVVAFGSLESGKDAGGKVGEGFRHEPVPVFEVLEAVLVGNVVAQHDSMGTVNVVIDHLPANTLSTNVPELEGDVNVAGQGYLLDEEVHADRLLVRGSEGITSKARRDRRLSNSAIANQDDLEGGRGRGGEDARAENG